MNEKRALVRPPGPRLADGLLTHLDRQPVDLALARRQWEGYAAAMESEGWQLVEVEPEGRGVEGRHRAARMLPDSSGSGRR